MCPCAFLPVICWCGLLAVPSIRGAIWRPVMPEELALKASKTDTTADAQGLFREVHVLNESAE